MTHVVLPVAALLRRADLEGVIGAELAAKAAGQASADRAAAAGGTVRVAAPTRRSTGGGAGVFTA